MLFSLKMTVEKNESWIFYEVEFGKDYITN